MSVCVGGGGGICFGIDFCDINIAADRVTHVQPVLDVHIVGCKRGVVQWFRCIKCGFRKDFHGREVFAMLNYRCELGSAPLQQRFSTLLSALSKSVPRMLAYRILARGM